MKTILHPLKALVVTTLASAQLMAQTSMLCMHDCAAEQTPSVSMQESVHSPVDETLANFSLEYGNMVKYTLPAETIIADLLILSETGKVVYAMKLETSSDARTGYIKLNELPAGKYYIKLLADYAVVASEQLIKSN